MRRLFSTDFGELTSAGDEQSIVVELSVKAALYCAYLVSAGASFLLIIRREVWRSRRKEGRDAGLVFSDASVRVATLTVGQLPKRGLAPVAGDETQVMPNNPPKDLDWYC